MPPSTMEDLATSMRALTVTHTGLERINLFETVGRDGVITSASLKVKAATQSGGLGLFTTGDISAGEEIFRIDSPHFYASSRHEGHKACDNCLIPNQKSLEFVDRAALSTLVAKLECCGACKQVSYCSKACQRQGWKKFHKFECKTLQKLGAVNLNDQLHLTLRILCLEREHQFGSQVWDVLSSLEAVSDIARNEWDASINICLLLIKPASGTARTQKEVNDLYSRVMLNNHCMGFFEGSHVGLVLHPFMALMNHSCNPTSFIINDGASFRLRSTMSIPKNGELTIGYIPLESQRNARLTMLTKDYGFVCKCSRCEDELQEEESEEIHFQSSPGVELAQRKIVEVVTAISTPRKTQKEIAQYTSTIARNAVPGQEWPDHLAPIPRIHRQLVGGYLGLQNWCEAFRNALRVSLVYDPTTFRQPIDIVKLYNQLKFLVALNGVEFFLANTEVEKLSPAMQKLKSRDHYEITYLRTCNHFLLIVDARKTLGYDHSITRAIEQLFATQNPGKKLDFLLGLKMNISDYRAKDEKFRLAEELIMDGFGVSKTERSFFLTTE